jgi:predicted nucleotidyltransferase
VARGEESGWSDVDLFIEVRSERDQDRVFEALYRLGSAIREQFGLNLAPIVVTTHRIRSSMSPSFLESVRRDQRVIRGSESPDTSRS